ncbi:hypothetical protein R69888_05587 [Paraburkholderia haematera]|jgi:hypothetical protein|uniref:Uncharacterized protein n=1 Tax=Paraburkholderia haematera TaxID=2793077 RepID=A0ABN7MK79_9BURK|nr:hypothetical protein R69888_05587 [Paraburkholderia haematera]
MDEIGLPYRLLGQLSAIDKGALPAGSNWLPHSASVDRLSACADFLWRLQEISSTKPVNCDG